MYGLRMNNTKQAPLPPKDNWTDDDVAEFRREWSGILFCSKKPDCDCNTCGAARLADGRKLVIR